MNQELIEQTVETPILNNLIAQRVIEAAIAKGVKEFCIAPGSRNTPLVYALECASGIKNYYWSEERSAAFFALGRIKATGLPVAVVTTSGTAAGEMLAAAMEAHYTSLPLLLITADRPRRQRGTGSPQTAEQVGLFGCYAHFEQDLADSEACEIHQWSCRGPAHLNVCFESPKEVECQKIVMRKEIESLSHPLIKWQTDIKNGLNNLTNFLAHSKCPLVVVGALHHSQREAVIRFLLHLQAPIYAEGISGIREDPRLEQLRITRIDRVWQFASEHKYVIDGVLRIGGVPTARLWRDLEDKQGVVSVCSISDHPFSGLSWGGVIHTCLTDFFLCAAQLSLQSTYSYQAWLRADQQFRQNLLHLFKEEPDAEASLFYALSCSIPKRALVYLGNSLPIREWDLAASYERRDFDMHANRGVNGIDGQVSTFLGLSQVKGHNWGIVGDLTALYDLVAPWILTQLPETVINLVIINNGGGQIFSRMYALPAILNAHDLHFDHLAAFWRLSYERWYKIPEQVESRFNRLIEIIPDAQATQRFWKKMSLL